MANDPDPSTTTEAQNLVKEAQEAEQQGDKEEAAFLKEAAKELDPKAKAPG